jgi:hypothetical protein
MDGKGKASKQAWIAKIYVICECVTNVLYILLFFVARLHDYSALSFSEPQFGDFGADLANVRR